MFLEMFTDSYAPLLGDAAEKTSFALRLLCLSTETLVVVGMLLAPEMSPPVTDEMCDLSKAIVDLSFCKLAALFLRVTDEYWFSRL